MAAVTEYQCPNCGGEIEFDANLQKMKCSYCGSDFDVATLKAYDEDLKTQQPDSINWNMPTDSWAEGESEGLSGYECQNCGAEIVGEETTGTVDCPYCGNHVILKGKFSGQLRPDLIIPFKLDKNMAKHTNDLRRLLIRFQNQQSPFAFNTETLTTNFQKGIRKKYSVYNI